MMKKMLVLMLAALMMLTAAASAETENACEEEDLVREAADTVCDGATVMERVREDAESKATGGDELDREAAKGNAVDMLSEEIERIAEEVREEMHIEPADKLLPKTHELDHRDTTRPTIDHDTFPGRDTDIMRKAMEDRARLNAN